VHFPLEKLAGGGAPAAATQLAAGLPVAGLSALAGFSSTAAEPRAQESGLGDVAGFPAATRELASWSMSPAQEQGSDLPSGQVPMSSWSIDHVADHGVTTPAMPWVETPTGVGAPPMIELEDARGIHTRLDRVDDALSRLGSFAERTDTTDSRVLDQLVDRLYSRVRGRLRSELLVDRERAGILTDFT
jgi:hypothetical protein